jgi:hypothetical protein
MSVIRWAAGHISEATLLADDDSIIAGNPAGDFPILTDMVGQFARWTVTARDAGTRPIVRGFQGGNYYGSWKYDLVFPVLTPDMVAHLWTEIFGESPVANTTAYVFSGNKELGTDGWITIQNEAKWFLDSNEASYRLTGRRGYFGEVVIPLRNGRLG